MYTVDLTKIEGDGTFKCPKCGVKISPQDETEDVYRIIEVIYQGGYISGLILVCNKCGSKVKLIGIQ